MISTDQYKRTKNYLKSNAKKIGSQMPILGTVQSKDSILSIDQEYTPPFSVGQAKSAPQQLLQCSPTPTEISCTYTYGYTLCCNLSSILSSSLVKEKKKKAFRYCCILPILPRLNTLTNIRLKNSKCCMLTKFPNISTRYCI